MVGVEMVLRRTARVFDKYWRSINHDVDGVFDGVE